MNWLLDNPISQMPGPLFLALYAAIIAFVLVEALWRKRRADHSQDTGPEPIPIKPDALEIAYLRGGPNEVTCLLVFDLIRRGYLQVEEKKGIVGVGKGLTISQVATQPGSEKLPLLEARVFGYFQRSHKPSELFQQGGLTDLIKKDFEPLVESLHERQLLTTRDQVGAAWKNWLAGAVMILAFGGFKFYVAMSKGKHNVAFLIIFAVVGLIALAIACAVPRLTRRGKDYLARLRLAFMGLKDSVGQTDALRVDPALLLVPAVFGVSALAATPYSYATSIFRASQISSGTGGGGGCSGGGGGCGGGGGGGGCGGGGCGGCGS
jgi:uncharacterized protein (TIGR04222 family)